MVSINEPPLKGFVKMWSSCHHVSHDKNFLKLPPEFKDKFMRTVMPNIMTIGREHMPCRETFHPYLTCRAYFFDKLFRSI